MPTKTANRALAAPETREAAPENREHILRQTTCIKHKMLHQILALRAGGDRAIASNIKLTTNHPNLVVWNLAKIRGSDAGSLEKCDPYLRVCPPHRAARAPNPFNHDIEIHRDTISRRHLQAGACVRKISNTAIELRRLVTEDQLRGFEYALARAGSVFVHGQTLRIGGGLGD